MSQTGCYDIHLARRPRLPFVRVCRSTPHAGCAATFSAIPRRTSKPLGSIAAKDVGRLQCRDSDKTAGSGRYWQVTLSGQI